MDRLFAYPGAIPLETDLLSTNRNTMVALAWAMQSVLGTSTCLSGLACTPTSPATLGVQVAPGAIYSLQNLEATAYSSLPADTAHNIVKQGLSLDSVPLSCPAPTTSGFSVVYLVQAAYQDQDSGSTVLPYYNSSNPSVAYSGPANSGTAQYTTRKGVCVLAVKAGVAAATGTQVAPAADVGYVGLFTVTVAYGQVSVTSPNIVIVSGAPFVSETLTQKISQATGDARYLLASVAGALAALGIGAGLENDGSGNLRVKNPVNAKTAQASYTLAATDRAALVRRSNSGAAMTDTLPGGGSVLPAGWATAIVNNDTAASITISGGSSTLTGTLTSTSPTITAVSSAAGLAVGQPISGTGIPAGTTILSINAGAATITMSANATAGGAGVTVTASSQIDGGASLMVPPGQSVTVNSDGANYWSERGTATYRRNILINGAMRVAQRGASGALTTAFTYPSLDRWCAMQAGTAAGILAQVAGGQTSFQYAMKLARNSGASAAGAITVLQAQESINSIPLAGQTVTLSFWAKAGANYSGGALVSTVTQGAGTDQSAASYATWTGAIANSQNNTLTTSYQRFAQILALSASTTQLATSFAWTPSGTAGADDAVYITGVQLEASSSATAFEVIDYGEERRRCQRYCFSGPTQSAGLGASAGGGFGGAVALPVEMRATPALSTSGVTYVNCYSLTTTQITPTGYVAWVVTSSANSYYVIFTILASAEL
jgi:hypothetical protein